LSKQKKVSRQVESQTEKQWHTRCEALLLRYKQHADYMQTYVFIRTASCHDSYWTFDLRHNTIAPADLLLPASILVVK